jgi:hypothetical protein
MVLRYLSDCIESGGDLSRTATVISRSTVPSFERRDTASLPPGGSMQNASQNSVSTSSHKKKTKWDFRVEYHGAILLLVPLSDGGLRWIERCIGADNGYQPYYPTVVLEPRFMEDVLQGTPLIGS